LDYKTNNISYIITLSSPHTTTHQNKTMQENVGNYHTQFLHASTGLAYNETGVTLSNKHPDVTVLCLVRQLTIAIRLHY